MTRNRKIVLASVAGLLFLLSGAAALGWLVWQAHQDDPPPNDADVVLARKDIPEGQNALALFEEAGEALVWPGSDEETDLLARVTSGEAWDGDLMEHTLADNEEALGLWQQGMAVPRLQVPEVRDVGPSPSPAFKWLHLAQCALLRSRSLFAEGREAEAIETAMQAAEFGRRIEHAKGILVDYLVGMTVRGMALEHLRQLVSETTLEPGALKKYADRLAPNAADDEALADAYRGEYGMDCGALESLVDGRRSPTGPPFFKVNRTRAWFVEDYRRMIAEVPKTLAEGGPGAIQIERDIRASQTQTAKLKAILGGNMFGSKLKSMLTPDFYGALQLKCQERADLEGTRLVIALKGFEKSRGHLPEKLDELVPEFIDAVPRDPFDGKPMRWSKEKKIVWAVGKDLVDDGGDDFQDPDPNKNRGPKDAVYHLDPRKSRAERGVRSAESV